MTSPVDSIARPPRSTGKDQISQRELLALISALMALMALAIDLMLPAFDDMRTAFDLGESSNEVSQVITVFFFGLAVAQLVYGPLADRFGRKPVLYLGISIYVAGAVGSALAPTFELLLVSRFIWGIGAAGARVVATAIIRDSFVGVKMAKAMSQVMAVFMLVPVFAPSIGAAIIAFTPWQGVFWFCVVWAFLMVLWSRRLPETLDPQNRRRLDVATIAGGFAEVARNRVTMGYTLVTVFLQAGFVAYLGSSEVIISDILGRGDQFPVVFGAVAVTFGVAALLNGRLVEQYGSSRVVRAALAGYVSLAFVILVLAISTDGRPSFWVFMPLLAVNLAMTIFLMPNLNAAALTPMGELAGSAASLTGATRIAGGAVLGALVDSQMGPTSLEPFAVALVLLGVCAAAVTLLTEQIERRASA